MIHIKKINILDDFTIRFFFSDESKKVIDLKPFLRKGTISGALLNPEYFRKAKLYEDGRGIYWPNGFDFCPDFLYSHTTNLKEEPVK